MTTTGRPEGEVRHAQPAGVPAGATSPVAPAPVPASRPAASQASEAGASSAPQSAGPSAQVLALFDNPSAARALLEISSALAQLMQRELQVVYLESAAALAAAQLPPTQVLAAALGQWAPLAPLDVSQGFAQEAGRLRALAEQAAQPRAVPWSMRILRGALHDTTLRLMQQCNLVLVAGGVVRLGLPAVHQPCRAVTALDDGTAASAQALQIAARLTSALGAQLQRQSVAAGAGWALAAPADLLVLPHTLQPTLASHRVPRPATLLVGPMDEVPPGP